MPSFARPTAFGLPGPDAPQLAEHWPDLRHWN